MKLERTKNSLRNIAWGIINRFITLLFPFVLRTILIQTLGAEYLGLNSLFTSILSVLNLAELGFSSAIVFSMYKPIAQNDNKMICALMAYYRKVYSVIGLVITGLGLIILPFLPQLIKGSHPSNINLYSLYLLFLINTTISYFLFAYKLSILTAHQREDILSKVEIGIRAICYTLQAIVLLRLKNYYLYILLNIVYTIIYNITSAIWSNKLYPQYKCIGLLDAESKRLMRKNIGGLMIGKLCMVSRNSFDSIFISAFLGLQIVAIYGNYYYIMNAIIALLTICMTSISAGIGNSVATETVEKNYRDMNKIAFIYSWIAGWCTVCLCCLYQPFMKLWMGDDMLFPMSNVCLICVYFYTLSMGDVRSKYANAAGLYWESRNYVLAEAVVNIILNYILGKIAGVQGIIIATILTIVFINFVWGTRVVFNFYFINYKFTEYIYKHCFYFIIILFGIIVTYSITNLIGDRGINTLVVKAIICIIVPNIIFYLSYCRCSIFKDAKGMVDNILKVNAKC
jgi:O-antigen/teichoic acid export membrane protein